MRAAELVNVVAFTFLTGLACLRPLPLYRRARAVAMGGLGLSLIWVAQSLGRFLPPLAVSVIRDWLPSPLLLMVYWQAGQFFLHPDGEFQSRLLRLDTKLVDPVLRWLAGGRARGWVASYLEIAYLLCYPLVPFALGALYLLHKGRYADQFWAAVLPPTDLCYLMVPFIQTLPPRMLAAGPAARGGRVRTLNLGILRHVSIQANTFPSAHVAASLAAALVLFAASPWVAWLFLMVAISIACGAVIGRYHYAADAILGAALAIAVFLALRLLRLW
jgi:membrane-associated phospholipid phosphatase